VIIEDPDGARLRRRLSSESQAARRKQRTLIHLAETLYDCPNDTKRS
jgi:hypothetical protein